MVWIAGSLIVLGSLTALVVVLVRRAPQPTIAAPPQVETLAQRVRRLEDEVDDLGGQVRQLQDDLQVLHRQLEDRP